MSQKIKSIFLAGLPAIVITTFLAAVVIYAWSEPSSPPPSGNVSAPLNVSGAGQSKLGALTVSGGFESTGITLLGTGGANVGIGTTNPTTGKLVVSGGDVDVSGNRIKNVPTTPISGTDAVNKDYVLAASGGGGCYEVFGSNACAAGYTAVVNGYTTGYYFSLSSGSATVNAELKCSPLSRSGGGSLIIYGVTQISRGLEVNNEPCAICCK